MIAIVSGTNRPDSNTRKVVGQIESLYKKQNAVTSLIDLANLPPGIFDPGSYAEKPTAFKPFSDGVLEADGLVVVTPEYNGGMPGVLKYFIDMLEFPESFEAKPVCFVGLAAGSWGALRPVEQLQQIFGYRNAHIYPKRVFLSGIYDLLDDTGAFTDEDIVGRLEKQAVGFIDFVKRLK